VYFSLVENFALKTFPTLRNCQHEEPLRVVLKLLLSAQKISAVTMNCNFFIFASSIRRRLFQESRFVSEVKVLLGYQHIKKWTLDFFFVILNRDFS
jgi:RsiW-degrading membrane proteinase PrsW (M82 family)